MLESKVWSVKVGHKASACLPRFLWHPSYTIGCARSDWLRGWLCFFQPGGWQAERRISPDCCISQSVRPQFLATVRLDEHHRNNKKMQGCQSSAKMCLFGWWSFFFSPCFVGSSLSIFLLVSLEAFAFWAMLRRKTGDTARVKKNWRFFGFLGETEEVFDVGEFSWRQITHFDILRTISAFKKKNAGKKRQYKHHIRSYKHTNIHTYTLSKSSFELPPSWKICRDFCLWIFVFHTAEFLKVAIFLMTNERKPVLLDFQRKIN